MPNSRKSFLAVIACLFFSFGFYSQELTAVSGTQFSAVIVQTMPDNKQMTGKLYVGDKLVRTEMGQRDQQRITIVNSGRGTVWTLNSSRKEYVEMQGQAQGDMPSRPPLPGEPGSFCEQGKGLTCTKLGVEQVNGRHTEKWQLVMSRDEQTVRWVAWVDRSLGVAVKEELPGGFVRELREIHEGPQEPTLFQVPSDYKRIEIPKQPPGQPGSERAPGYR